MMDGGMMALVGSSMVGSRLMVGGLALILDVHHIARVAIGSVIGHNLGATIREEDMVAALCGVAIAGFLSTKVNIAFVGVLGIDTILVSIMGLRGFVFGLMGAATVVRGRGMGDRFMVDGGVVDRGMMDRSMLGHPVVSNSHSGKGSSEDKVLNGKIKYYQG